MSTTIHLTQELEGFARSCVESGRFKSVSEVIRSGLRLLQEQEARREQFTAMLEAVQHEAERNGVHSLDSILAEVDEIIVRTEQ